MQRVDVAKAADSFLWAVERAFRLGMQASTGGNISLRLAQGGFLTKPTGLALTECTPQDLVLLGPDGKVLDSRRRPTKEVHAHLAVYGQRPEVGGIVHYHAPHATAYAVRGLPLPQPTVHARRQLGPVPLVPEHPDGSAELAQAVGQACRDPQVKGLLLAGHGLLALGASLEQAQYTAELMEESARVGLLAAMLEGRH
ncbi:MAG: class II aldolase/adducin family protein [Desulfarculus sp.]|nr:MAG: class II aldolase/adducin family protein [Desulfarculus sp.]